MTKAEQVRLTAWRLRVLRQAADAGNVARVCRRFGISRKSFYKWKRRHAEYGDAGLGDRPRTPQRSPRATAPRGRQQDPLLAPALSLRSRADRGVFAPVPLHHHCSLLGASDPDAARHASAPSESEAPVAWQTLATLREATARSSLTAGREVFGAHSGDATTPLSVHGDG